MNVCGLTRLAWDAKRMAKSYLREVQVVGGVLPQQTHNENVRCLHEIESNNITNQGMEEIVGRTQNANAVFIPLLQRSRWECIYD